MSAVFTFPALISVALGGACGAMLRYIMTVAVNREYFPYGTVVINISGSFLLGMLAAWFLNSAWPQLPDPMRLFLATGVLGGFTTFSAFSLEAMKLMQNGAVAVAAVYVTVSVVGSLAAVFLGYYVLRGWG
ncbi:MAG: fluoride efflux transporter CrcB [Micavibrio sp.]|nr:MAG: fluoride efflux transporter CrcB [Micavibrio sp.]